MSYFLEKNRYVALSLLGAILGYLAWPPSYFSPLIFITFVPLLWLSNELSHQKNKQSQRNTAILLFFLLWNSSVTWWMQKATLVGFLSAAVCNALFMCIPFLLFLRTQKKMGNYLGYLSFILYWLSMEYLHHNWELAWPWLTLGNVFALYPQYIQWYSITGVAGGSLWVLSVNVLVFLSLKQYVLCHYQWRNKQFLTKLSQTLLLIFIPIIFSLGLFYNYQEKGTPVEITVVQPNINPYTEKFRGSTYKKQMQRLFSLSEAATTPNTRFVLWPETAIPGRVWFETIGKSAYISQIENWLSTYNSLSIITGATVLKAYNNKPNSLKQKIQQKPRNYAIFNAALLLNLDKQYQQYYKSKLVPGVEHLPYSYLFNFLDGLSINVGDIVGTSNKTQKERTVLFNKQNIGIAPVICYESVFGEYVTDYVKKGASIIGIITNDGWWGNSPAHLQHLYYGSLRAIENRRSIVRSANTGVSGFINQKGVITLHLPYGVTDALNSTVYANTTITFYTKYGDYISRVAVLLSSILLLYTVLFKFTKHRLQAKK